MTVSMCTTPVSCLVFLLLNNAFLYSSSTDRHYAGKLVTSLATGDRPSDEEEECRSNPVNTVVQMAYRTSSNGLHNSNYINSLMSKPRKHGISCMVKLR